MLWHMQSTSPKRHGANRSVTAPSACRPWILASPGCGVHSSQEAATGAVTQDCRGSGCACRRCCVCGGSGCVCRRCCVCGGSGCVCRTCAIRSCRRSRMPPDVIFVWSCIPAYFSSGIDMHIFHWHKVLVVTGCEISSDFYGIRLLGMPAII